MKNYYIIIIIKNKFESKNESEDFNNNHKELVSKIKTYDIK